MPSLPILVALPRIATRTIPCVLSPAADDPHLSLFPLCIVHAGRPAVLSEHPPAGSLPLRKYSSTTSPTGHSGVAR